MKFFESIKKIKGTLSIELFLPSNLNYIRFSYLLDYIFFNAAVGSYQTEITIKESIQRELSPFNEIVLNMPA